MDPAPAPSGKWTDLRTRILSAIVMVTVGAVEIWLGGTAFAVLVVVLTGVMVWELAGMTQPLERRSALVVAAVTGVALVAALALKTQVAVLFLAVPSAVLVLTPRRDRWLSGIYALAILLAGYGLVILRDAGGTTVILWLVAVVVASDVLGYFTGRMLGGPKFWPAISPKKTWSGTVAGWIGAALVGLVVVLTTGAGWALVPLSALVAFAGQMGDIAESWVKRRAGVKDASALIPGHGGVLDRFDALIGAVVLVMALGLVAPVAGLFGG
ncbi:phosphatidate cytidylyltransferase [Tabrizicola sp.]|uniref:phosphatidate cytidylyltransferase n=1 Tax=Tabrizicola sp. TaxID=2005166 RepID=UPI0011D741A3|nr:phosphatidate cytidylyltransferase [Tabrizicola sp.]MBL9072423.1 phosphatidate cytidylyltransferase [Tabrizicola sp.]TXH83755.1 MAG: phosphatidate cytidylyltransferase [Rhizobium sp.]